VKANKKTLMAVKSFLTEEQESWDLDELKSEMVAKAKLLHTKEMGNLNLATDECGIEWDGKYICNLSDFVDAYTNIFIENICNVLDSFVGNDISYYSENEDE
jgi:hypothetical protein